MRRGIRGAYTALALATLLASAGCVKKKNDINDVGTDQYIGKSELTGCSAGVTDCSTSKVFSHAKVIMSGNEELDSSGLVPGFHADLGFVEFVVTRDHLQVRRVGEINRDEERASVVASFPIEKHFDIKREVNDFGEETNKIIEDEKRPWDQREFMRVDWGANTISSTELRNVFSTQINEEGSKVVSPLKKEGGYLSFNIDTTVTQRENFHMRGNGDEFFHESGALRAQIKYSFLEVPASDFARRAKREMPNQDFARFGYFRTFENFIDPNKGVTVSGKRLYANKFNVCENNANTRGLSCATNKIVYTLNKGFDDEFLPGARKAVAAWNKVFQKALNRTDDVVVLDESIRPEIGDIRYNMIAGINEKVPTGLLGVSQTSNNPHTGETISARSSVYMGTIKLLGGLAGEQLDLIVSEQAFGEIPGVTTPFFTFGAPTAQKTIQDRLSLNLKSKAFNRGQMVKPDLSASTIQQVVRKSTRGLAQDKARKSAIVKNHPALFAITEPAWNSSPEEHAHNHSEFEKAMGVDNSHMLEKMKSLALAEKGIHDSDYIEPAVEHYIRKYAAEHAGEDITVIREGLVKQVRQLAFFNTLVHEMGHNFGLRHNFASSADKKNYTPKWYELEAQKQALAAKDPNDPRIAEITLEQESYDYTSTMDYTAEFHETADGVGNYDLAAIRFGYNTSIQPDADPITGLVRNLQFCTDHQVGESLTCQRFDKGSTVSEIVSNQIDRYKRSYAFGSFRRDREKFRTAGQHLARVFLRTMLPVRQTLDEMIYQVIVSPSSAVPANQCGLDFLRSAVERGEMANLCDPDTAQLYVQVFGEQVLEWENFTAFLLNPVTQEFLKDPTHYQPNGFADLLLAGTDASNFFLQTLAAPEPGKFVPMADGNLTMLHALPQIGSSEDEQIQAFMAQNGLPAEAEEIIKANLVDLKPGPQAKHLMSRFTSDGGYLRRDSIGFLYDKLAAMLAMGIRGMPVQKYANISMNVNFFTLPQTKGLSIYAADSLINERDYMALDTYQTRSGAFVRAAAPVGKSFDMKVLGIVLSLSDYVSDQTQDFMKKMTICLTGDERCQNQLALPEVSFVGVDGQTEFKATQVLDGDSIAYNIIERGDVASKARLQAVNDIRGQDVLVEQAKNYSADTTRETSRSILEASFRAISDEFWRDQMNLFAKAEDTGVESLWASVMSEAQAGTAADLNLASERQQTLANSLGAVQEAINKVEDEQLKFTATTALAEVAKDLQTANSLIYRIVASGQIFRDTTTEIEGVEADARLILGIVKELNL